MVSSTCVLFHLYLQLIGMAAEAKVPNPLTELGKQIGYEGEQLQKIVNDELVAVHGS